MMRGGEREFQRILVVRTDRIGDVILTVPAMQALRRLYPEAFLAVLATPTTRDLLRGHSWIDEVMVDDRRGRHQGPRGFLRLVAEVRNRRFDLAVVFHIKKRTNWLCFLAGIPHRLGYAGGKASFLLTRSLPDERPSGRKHETEYCLDVVRTLGTVEGRLSLSLPVPDEAREWAEAWVRRYEGSGPLAAVHLGASCPTKRWPVRCFAEVVGVLQRKHRCRVVLIGAAGTRPFARELLLRVSEPVDDLTGETSLMQTAALLERCDLLISNDSGPVHLAAAVGTPVVSIFTRNQPGINPARWRPLGPKSFTVAPPRREGISFASGRVEDPSQLESVRVEEVLRSVDALFELC